MRPAAVRPAPSNALLGLAIALTTLALPIEGAVADDLGAAATSGDSEVIANSERASAQELGSQGPTNSSGIDDIRVLGTVPLAGQIADVDGMQLRAREAIIAVGGEIAVHQHEGRPGVAYIVSGELTEHRSGTDGPVVMRAGDSAFEDSQTVHWWRNDGTEPARMIVVDLVPIE